MLDDTILPPAASMRMMQYSARLLSRCVSVEKMTVVERSCENITLPEIFDNAPRPMTGLRSLGHSELWNWSPSSHPNIFPFLFSFQPSVLYESIVKFNREGIRMLLEERIMTDACWIRRWARLKHPTSNGIRIRSCERSGSIESVLYLGWMKQCRKFSSSLRTSIGETIQATLLSSLA